MFASKPAILGRYEKIQVPFFGRLITRQDGRNKIITECVALICFFIILPVVALVVKITNLQLQRRKHSKCCNISVPKMKLSKNKALLITTLCQLLLFLPMFLEKRVIILLCDSGRVDHEQLTQSLRIVRSVN